MSMLSSAVRDVASSTAPQQTYEVSQSLVTVYETSATGVRTSIVSVSLVTTRALSVTVDFEAARELVLEVTLEATKGTVAASINHADFTAGKSVAAAAALAPFHLELLSPAGGESAAGSVCVAAASEATPLQLLIPLAKADILQTTSDQRFSGK